MVSKYSASYNKINPNFCIFNIKKDNINDRFVPIFAVVQNILNRGVHIRPSDFLKEKLGEVECRKFFFYTVDKTKKEWSNTIKGSAKINPALEFYEEHLFKSLSNSMMLYSSFIPECPLSDIVYLNDNKIGEQVDFYSPLLKLVIEIDGSQHCQEEQKSLDMLRDQKFRSNGIKVVRISTSNIANNKYLDSVCKKIVRDNKLDWIKTHSPFDDINTNEKQYLAVVRFQFLLLELLRNGKLLLEDREWKINLTLNEEIDINVFYNAYEDLMNLIVDVSFLHGIRFNKPILKLNIDEVNFKEYLEGINVNFSINMLYDETCYSEEIVYVRNDYFMYNQDAETESSSYASSKNYYTVACADAKYNIDFNNIHQHNALLRLLKRIFGFEKFNPNQEEIIINCLNGQATVGLLPTSAGKSLCYQMVAMLTPALTLVVAPLTSLMEDQVSNLIEYGIDNVAFLNHNNKEKFEIIKNNKSLMTIISPERFFSSQFTNYIVVNASKFDLIAIDEVHCISEWGHDFRTSYLCLFHMLKKYFKQDCKLIGLTATASPNVSEDILVEFNSFKKNTLVVSAYSLERKELKLHPIKFKDNTGKEKWLKKFLLKNPNLNEKTLVFTKKANSNKKADSACIQLCGMARESVGFQVDFYASESACKKYLSIEVNNAKKMSEFKNGETILLFSTKAFGMGVNIPDIRNTIHYGIPSSIESLYQEFGRAGRDKQNSNCYILFAEESQKNINCLNAKTIKELALSSNKMNELGSNLYFLTNSNRDIDPETEATLKFIEFLENLGSNQFELDDIDFIPKKDKILVDKMLYRLLLLGIIEMWSMLYTTNIDNPIYTDIELTNISLKGIKNNLEKYIRRYTAESINEYSYTGKETREAMIKEIVTWTFDHFTRNQIDSIKNVYEYCSKYKTSKELMTAIVQFLTVDPGLRGVIEQVRPTKWIEYIKSTNPEERKHKVNRMIESYGESTALNYIAALTRLELEGFENNDGKTRFEESLDNMQNQDDSFKRVVIKETIRFAKAKNKQDDVIPSLVKYFPKEVVNIYIETKSEYCERVIMTEFYYKVKNLGGIVNARLGKNGSDSRKPRKKRK